MFESHWFSFVKEVGYWCNAATPWLVMGPVQTAAIVTLQPESEFPMGLARTPSNTGY